MAEADSSTWVQEELGPFAAGADRPGGSLGTGRFSAMWRTNGDEQEGPSGVSVDEAISWGRARSPIVIVLVCDDSGGGAHFSAGERRPSDWRVGPLHDWPEHGGLAAARRIASGLSLEQEAGKEQWWELEVVVFAKEPANARSLIAPWTRELGQQADVLEVFEEPAADNEQAAEVSERGFWARLATGSPVAVARVRLPATDRDQAELLASELAERAQRQALGELASEKRLAFRARAAPASAA